MVCCIIDDSKKLLDLLSAGQLVRELRYFLSNVWLSNDVSMFDMQS